MRRAGGPTNTGWRLFRAGVFAVLATQLAALGHLLGGGQLPDPVVLITVTLFLGGSLSGLATRRRSWPQILLGLLASQIVFHVAFLLTAHQVAGGRHGSADGWRMVAFHVIAALATSWLMAGGESMLFRLFAALHRAVLVRPARPAVGVRPSWTAVIEGGVAGRLLLLAGSALRTRRGPPATNDQLLLAAMAA